jgi:hypothetical protein
MRGRSLARRTVKEVGGEPAIAECYCTKLKCVCKQFITNKLLVEAAGVELSSVLTTRKLLILGTATTAKKAPLPDPLYVYCTKRRFALEFNRHTRRPQYRIDSRRRIEKAPRYRKLPPFPSSRYAGAHHGTLSRDGLRVEAKLRWQKFGAQSGPTVHRGRVLVCDLDAFPQMIESELVDLNSLKPEAIAVPDWAKLW